MEKCNNVSMETKKEKETNSANIDQKIIEQFKEFYEKQELIEKQTTDPFIHSYGHLELHTIAAIEDNQRPNVSLIAKKLDITRGAVSKITRRLLQKGDIAKYQLNENKKEVYFSLTEQGKRVYLAHEKRHEIWKKNDLRFLSGIPQDEKQVVHGFLLEFNLYLQDLLASTEQEQEE